MILTIDVGNSQIFGGVFVDEILKLKFRKHTSATTSSDEFGVYLRQVLRENEISPEEIKHIAIASVVPSINHSLRNGCRKYFKVEPFFLTVNSTSQLTIKTRNPSEVGADRIANAIASINRYPGQAAIIIDFGTATTFCAVSREAEYLGCVILPGLRISMEALESRTARLTTVEIIKREQVLGRSNIESIQSGLYYSNLGAAKEIITRITNECFSEIPVIIGTGGFSRLYEDTGLFNALIPDLVLEGVKIAYEASQK
jgi:type III pantothenate kinase